MAIRTLTISAADSGRTLAAVLGARLGISKSRVRELIAAGQVRVNGVSCADPTRRLRAGQELRVRAPEEPKPQVKPQAKPPAAGDAEPVIRHADLHIVVVEKPAGLTTMRHTHESAEFGERGQRFLPPTLADLLPRLLGVRTRVRAVHRLDRDTSGLVVFARTVEAERHLGQQFRSHRVTRTYLALVRGRAISERIESYLVDDRGDGRRGSSPDETGGKKAVTHVRVVEELGDFALVECRLETGRTHQVRIHLGERGTPLCGERIYDRPPHGKPLPDTSGARRPTLHAATLGFVHPASGKQMSWTAALPKDMADLLIKLRRSAARPPQ
jgi:23S rRNA pseudouridine1911/1915/1917 synthase